MNQKDSGLKLAEHSRTITPERAIVTANEHCIFNYSFGLIGTTPHLLAMADKEAWVVPIVLTSPGFGAVGEVGIVAVDAVTGQVVGSTPRPEVEAAQKSLREVHHDAIEAAFLRAKQA